MANDFLRIFSEGWENFKSVVLGPSLLILILAGRGIKLEKKTYSARIKSCRMPEITTSLHIMEDS